MLLEGFMFLSTAAYLFETQTTFIGRDKNGHRTYSALVKLDHKEVFQFEVCSVYVQRAEREALNNCNEWIASPLVTAASWMSCPASSLRLLNVIRFDINEIVNKKLTTVAALQSSIEFAL